MSSFHFELMIVTAIISHFTLSHENTLKTQLLNIKPQHFNQ